MLEGDKKTYKIWLKNQKGRNHLGDRDTDGRIIKKMYLRDIVYGVNSTKSEQDSIVDFCEQTNGPLGSIKDMEVPDMLGDL